RSCHGVQNLALSRGRTLSGPACRRQRHRRRIIERIRQTNRSRNARGDCAPHAGTKLSADAELLDQSLVASLVGAPPIIEQGTALAHHLEQSTAGMLVLDVG